MALKSIFSKNGMRVIKSWSCAPHKTTQQRSTLHIHRTNGRPPPHTSTLFSPGLMRCSIDTCICKPKQKKSNECHSRHLDAQILPPTHCLVTDPRSYLTGCPVLHTLTPSAKSLAANVESRGLSGILAGFFGDGCAFRSAYSIYPPVEAPHNIRVRWRRRPRAPRTTRS
jgi:hypothetical protein